MLSKFLKNKTNPSNFSFSSSAVLAIKNLRTINPNIYSAVIEYAGNKKGLMAQMMEELSSKNVDINYIEGNVIEKNARGIESIRFNIQFQALSPLIDVANIRKDMRDKGFNMRMVEPPILNWMPLSINELDIIT